MIELSWPPKELNPNSTAKLRSKMRAKKLHREEAYWSMKAYLGQFPGYRIPDGPVPIVVTFYPPDRRKRDDDNMQGSFKRARDGLANALGIDDHRFEVRYQVGEPVKGGRVVVTL